MTIEEVEQKAEELCTMLEQLDDDDKLSAALSVCMNIANHATTTHFESIGLLTEATLRLREASLEALNECCDDHEEDADLGDQN